MRKPKPDERGIPVMKIIESPQKGFKIKIVHFCQTRHSLAGKLVLGDAVRGFPVVATELAAIKEVAGGFKRKEYEIMALPAFVSEVSKTAYLLEDMAVAAGKKDRDKQVVHPFALITKKDAVNNKSTYNWILSCSR